MKPLALLTLALAIVQSGAYAAPPRPKTGSGQHIKPGPRVDVLSQDVFELTEIPADYRNGVNLAGVVKQLEALDNLTKNEYEKSDEFQARQQAALYVSSLAPDKGQLGFVIDGNLTGVQFVYNADKGQYQVTQSISYHSFCQSTPFLALPKGTPSTQLCVVGILNHKKSTYNGQNAFGVTSEVDKERGTYVSVSIPLASPFFQKYHDRIYNFNDAVDFPLDQARKYKSSDLRMMLVGRINGINTIRGEGKITQPRIDHPFDIFIENKGVPFKPEAIVYFFRNDGKVLATRDLRESN